MLTIYEQFLKLEDSKLWTIFAYTFLFLYAAAVISTQSLVLTPSGLPLKVDFGDKHTIQHDRFYAFPALIYHQIVYL